MQNQQQSKRWLKIFFINIAIFIISFVFINYIIDPYGYNNTFLIKNMNNNKTQTEAQNRKFKVGLSQTKEFQGLFLGSSEMTFLGNTDYASKLTNTNFFNLAFNEQEMYESLEYLKYILKEKNIKHIIFGLHPFKFGTTNKNYRQDTPKNIISKKNDLISYLSYKTFFDSIKTVYKNIKQRPIIYNKEGWKIVDILKYHNIPKEQQNKWIKNKVESSPEILESEAKKFEIDMEKVKYFYKIVDLCRSKNIKLQVFFTPMYHKHFLAIHKHKTDDINNLKYLIAQKTAFYDFSGINTVSFDHMNFIDRVSHAQQKVSYYILDTLINDIYFKDFGILVTKNNITDFIKNSNISLNRYKNLSKNP